MGIWHNWAVYQRAQVIYGVAIERKEVKDGLNGGKSDIHPQQVSERPGRFGGQVCTYPRPL